MEHAPDISLADVLPSCAASLGISGYHDRLGIGAKDVVVVVLIDGLGATAIETREDLFPVLAQARGGSIEASFPTTTATGLASLGTGVESGRHGLVGASFLLPETEAMLSPLHWGSQPSPLMVQPERTMFEVVRANDFRVAAISPVSYAGSGLTKAVLRGADYLAAEDLDQRVAAVADVTGSGPGLTYVYWPALDRAGHEFGIDSPQWRAAAHDVNELIDTLVTALPAHAALIVTADHGMVDGGERLWVEDHPPLMWGVRCLGGEPRMRHVYCEVGEVADVQRRWEDCLEDRAQVRPRDEAIADGLFGPVEADIAERIGDLVVVCEPGLAIGSASVDPGLSKLPGQHGALSDDERRIPGLILST